MPSSDIDFAYQRINEITRKMEEAFARGCRISSEIRASGGNPSRQNMERLVDALTLQINSTLEFVRVAREEILPAERRDVDLDTDLEVKSLKVIESMAKKKLILVQTVEMTTKERILMIEDARDLTADSLLVLSQIMGLTLKVSPE